MTSTPETTETMHPWKVYEAEYDQAKGEQRDRIKLRDDLVKTTLAVLASGIVAAHAIPSPAILLALPPVCLLLGWTYATNDRKISALGRYVREDLAPRVQRHLPGDCTAFGWETHHRADRYRLSGKAGQLVADLLMFCVSALVFLILYWCHRDTSATFMAVSIAELGLTGALAAQIIRYTDWEMHR